MRTSRPSVWRTSVPSPSSCRPAPGRGAARHAGASRPNLSLMSTPPRTRSIGRLSEIAQVMARHGFGYLLEGHRPSDLVRRRSAGERLANGAYAQGAGSTRGQHLREVLDELGPTFVKFGQLLSTRPDVVPPDIVLELRALQDDVRPIPFEDV